MRIGAQGAKPVQRTVKFILVSNFQAADRMQLVQNLTVLLRKYSTVYDYNYYLLAADVLFIPHIHCSFFLGIIQ